MRTTKAIGGDWSKHPAKIEQHDFHAADVKVCKMLAGNKSPGITAIRGLILYLFGSYSWPSTLLARAQGEPYMRRSHPLRIE